MVVDGDSLGPSFAWLRRVSTYICRPSTQASSARPLKGTARAIGVLGPDGDADPYNRSHAIAIACVAMFAAVPCPAVDVLYLRGAVILFSYHLIPLAIETLPPFLEHLFASLGERDSHFDEATKPQAQLPSILLKVSHDGC